jgi:hypothetical protein
VPRWPSEHTASAGQIRYFIGELERHFVLTQALRCWLDGGFHRAFRQAERPQLGGE